MQQCIKLSFPTARKRLMQYAKWCKMISFQTKHLFLLPHTTLTAFCSNNTLHIFINCTVYYSSSIIAQRTLSFSLFVPHLYLLVYVAMSTLTALFIWFIWYKYTRRLLIPDTVIASQKLRMLLIKPLTLKRTFSHFGSITKQSLEWNWKLELVIRIPFMTLPISFGKYRIPMQLYR